MKFAIPFLLSAAGLASLAWYLAYREPIKLPPGIAEKHRQSFLISLK